MLARIATLTEIETSWSIDDLFDCHDALDTKEDSQSFESDRMRKEMAKLPKGRKR